VRSHAQDTVAQLGLEAVHHREHGDQRGDAQGDPQDGGEGDEGNETRAALGPRVAQANEQD